VFIFLTGARATSHSAVSILNAIGTGFGGALGINIPCTVRAKFVTRPGNLIVRTQETDKHALVSKCVSIVEDFLGRKLRKDRTLLIEIDSKIPVAVGLKSSSAVSTAVVSALSKLMGEELSARTILQLSCNASKVSGASITGAYDDAVSCFLGGLVLTNNLHFRTLRHIEIPKNLGETVILMIPKRVKVYTSSLKSGSYSKFKTNAKQAFELAKSGNYRGAIMMNSLIQCSVLGYSFEPISSALIEGAACAGISGKGPAVFAMCETKRDADKVEGIWTRESDQFKIIRTTVIQPKKLL
jgi:shikimate kinase